MKIASITVFCNEIFRLNDWIRYYSEYKDCITLHIIVNNGCPEDTELLKQSFPDSVVLESSNQNLLKAYNLGVKYALLDDNIDAIMQITNDIKFENGAIPKMYDVLFSKKEIAIVGPVLLKKDSQIVEVFGIDTYRNHLISGRQVFPYRGMTILDIPMNIRKVSYVSAGVIMQKRSAIEEIGFQDETINMYCDERDVAIRLRKLGYYEVVTKSAVAWHQHINKEGKTGRSLFAPFYSSRNSIYLIYKHSNIINAIWKSQKTILYHVALIVYHLLKGEYNKTRFDFTIILGTMYGLFKKMDNYPQWLLLNK